LAADQFHAVWLQFDPPFQVEEFHVDEFQVDE
jgi:hypothetical protein